GLKSIVQDEWAVLDLSDAEVGTIKEDSTLMALLRRFLSNLIPQSFHIRMGDQDAGMIKQHFNPLVLKHDVDLRPDSSRRFDRRLALAAVVLLLAIEGRQD
ncbi:MAG: hypothetical protein ACRD5I_15455, partial [Candidatus Acidiferrales bacterium]